MPAPAWENLDDFLSLEDFATQATFTTTGGLVIPAVAGIFDEPSFNAELGEYDMATSQPRFTCKAVDVVALKKYDVAVLSQRQTDGTFVPVGTYSLDHDPYPDGTGMAVLHLSPEP